MQAAASFIKRDELLSLLFYSHTMAKIIIIIMIGEGRILLTKLFDSIDIKQQLLYAYID
jgi:hypothetical protein